MRISGIKSVKESMPLLHALYIKQDLTALKHDYESAYDDYTAVENYGEQMRYQQVLFAASLRITDLQNRLRELKPQLVTILN